MLLDLALFAFSKQGSAGNLYKWIDENDQIRYSDWLPPSQVIKKLQQLNSQGMVLTAKEAARTDEQLAAEAEAARKLEEENARSRYISRVPNRIERSWVASFSPCITWPCCQY
jgi:hypothetical protein